MIAWKPWLSKRWHVDKAQPVNSLQSGVFIDLSLDSICRERNAHLPGGYLNAGRVHLKMYSDSAVWEMNDLQSSWWEQTNLTIDKTCRQRVHECLSSTLYFERAAARSNSGQAYLLPMGSWFEWMPAKNTWVLLPLPSAEFVFVSISIILVRLESLNMDPAAAC